MKIRGIISFAVILLFAVSSFAQKAGTAKGGSALEWTKNIVDVGTTPLNNAVTAEFAFTNKSKAPVFIKSAKASCGCTTPEYDKKPIPPGQTTKIKATYNAKKAGKFMKKVTIITSDTETPKILYIKGEVK